VVLGALAAVGAVALVHRRYRRSVVEVELGRQIARERRCARELEALRGAGWTMLHSGVTAIPLETTPRPPPRAPLRQASRR